MSVVAAGELQHLRPPGVPAGQADRRHGGLGAGVDEADLVDARALDDELGEFDLGGGGGAVAQSAGGGVLHGGDDLGVGVAHEHRAPGAEQVDVVVAVHVGEVAALGGGDEAALPADGTEGPDGRVHPARGERPGTLEPACGAVGVLGRRKA